MTDRAAQPDPPVDGLEHFGFESDEGWLTCFRRAEQGAALGQLGRYDILEEIGRGGQGVVYRARQAGVDRDLALKRLVGGAFAEAHTRQRFERELRAISALAHPNIVGVHAVDVIDGQPLLAMHWVDGRPINTWARDPGRDAEDRLAAFLEVCAAVHHAHLRGIMHRDLKPSNILVDASGRPHVLDFGLARRLDGAGDDPRVTTTQQFVGTPAYAAPEQLEHPDSAVDTRVDVYALGVVLFEMLTGVLPYDTRGSLVEIARTVSATEPPRPSRLDARLDPDIDAIVLKALAKDPARRYQSVEGLAEDIRRRRAGEPVLAHPPAAGIGWPNSCVAIRSPCSWRWPCCFRSSPGPASP